MAYRPYNLPRVKRREGLQEYHACPEAEENKRKRPEWESDELVGFETFPFEFEGRIIEGKIYTQGVPIQTVRAKRNRLQKCYKLLEWLRVRSRLVLETATDEELLQSIENFHESTKGYRFKNNKDVTHLRSKDTAEKLGFIRNGLDLFLRTNHTLSELSPSTHGFWAVNKPHLPIRADGTIPDGPRRFGDEVFMGADERMRAFDRTIVVNLVRDGGDENELMCLIVHEFAHTPPNHICFRVDDHKDDFRYFQWLFLNMAEYFDAPNKFVTYRDYV
jgi:hypothetical protein